MKSKFLLQEIFFKNSTDYKVSIHWKRFINFIIDYSPATMGFNLLRENCRCDEAYLIFLALFFYFILFEGLFGRTPGKFISRTKVICTKTNKIPSFFQIVSRTFIRFVPFEWISFLSNRPIGLHDSITGTKVVDETPINWNLFKHNFCFGYLPMKWKRLSHVILIVFLPFFPIIALISWIIEGFYKKK